MSKVPNPTRPLDPAVWSVTYRLAALQAGPMTRADLETIETNLYPEVLAAVNNTGVSPEKFGDAVLTAAKLMRRRYANQTSHAAFYLVGAASKPSFISTITAAPSFSQALRAHALIADGVKS